VNEWIQKYALEFRLFLHILISFAPPFQHTPTTHHAAKLSRRPSHQLVEEEEEALTPTRLGKLPLFGFWTKGALE